MENTALIRSCGGTDDSIPESPGQPLQAARHEAAILIMDEMGTPGEGTRRGWQGHNETFPRILFPRIAPMNRGGVGSSPAERDGFASCGDEPSPPRFMGRIAGHEAA